MGDGKKVICVFWQLAVVIVYLTAFGCASESELNPDGESASGSGLALTMDIRGPTDVGGMRFEIQEVDCESSEPGDYSTVIDKDLDDILLPGGIEDLAGSVLDDDSSHVFADAFILLEPGCYDVITTPLTAEGEISEDCAPAVLTGVEVLSGETTEVFLINQCSDVDDGAVDVISVLNHPPVIDNLWFVESKFVERCGSQVICATAYDSDNDPIEWVWTVSGTLGYYGPEEVETTVNDDGSITQCVEIIPLSAGKYEVNLTVYDLVIEDGVEVRVEDWLAEQGYASESNGSLDFPFYTAGEISVSEEICDGIDNDCDGETDEGLFIDEDGDGFGSEDSCPYSGDTSDCDDADDEVYPGAEEICDDKDNDCDASTMEYCCITGPVDVLILEDLSGSFSDDLVTIKDMAPGLWDAVSGTSTDVRLGVASFVDKPFSPYGSSSDYVFTINQPLTASKTEFVTAVDDLSIFSGGDFSEAQLEALLHTAAQAGTVGWRDAEDTLRYVILSTDATYHVGPECVAAGYCDTANNGDGVVDSTEDFPTVGMVATALAEENILPIFAVTPAVESTYTALLADLGVEGMTVNLSSDSANLVEAILAGIGCSDD